MELNPSNQRPLVYVTPFRPKEGKSETLYTPFVTNQLNIAADATVPHGISREIAACLPGLWYCLHLPRSLIDIANIQPWLLKASQHLKLGHRILLIPIDLFDEKYTSRFLRDSNRALVICPDDLIDEAQQRSSQMGFALPTASYSELSNTKLQSHWQEIHQKFFPNIDPLGSELSLTQRLDLAPTSLPHRILARQMGWDTSQPTEETNHDDWILNIVYGQISLATTARLERETYPAEISEEYFSQVFKEESSRLRFPLTLSLPGVAPAYSREAYDKELRSRIRTLKSTEDRDTWSTEIHNRSDDQVERAAIEFATTHNAISTSGLGLFLPSVPENAFTILAEIEKHFTLRANSTGLRRLMNRLNAATKSLWSTSLVEIIKRSSTLTVFSNFPLGLLTMPGDTSPLNTRIPIAYRPILPLTRTLQNELHAPASINLNRRVRVLVAECIPADDPVGRLSRLGWSSTIETVRPIDAISIKQVEIPNIESLRSAVSKEKPDFLIISAHGRINGLAAGLVIGDKTHLELGLSSPPLVVILSACHVAPRGNSSVSISDILLREGVLAVLGTQVPVRVDHNAVFMGRFLANLAEEMTLKRHATILDLWHHVQSLNAVNDILQGNSSLKAWGTSMTSNEISVLEEFMLNRSPGKLRRGTVYQDTENILGEIAEEQGVGGKVRNWLRHPGYVAESSFYIFCGRPDWINLSNVEEHVEKYHPTNNR